MARVNYAHGKRQREMASKRKREEKLQRKADRNYQAPAESDGVAEGPEAGSTAIEAATPEPTVSEEP